MLVYRREAYIKNNEVALAFQCCSITACISLEDDSYQTAGVSIAHFSGDDFFVCVWKNVINLVAFVFHFLAFIFMEGRRTREKPGGEECWLLLQESKEHRSPCQAASQRGAAWHLRGDSGSGAILLGALLLFQSSPRACFENLPWQVTSRMFFIQDLLRAAHQTLYTLTLSLGPMNSSSLSL